MRLREAGYKACCREALGGKRIGPFASRLLAKRIEENGECGAAADEIQRLSIAAVVKSPMFTGVSPQDLDREITRVASQKRHAVLGAQHCSPNQRPRFRDAFQHRGLSRRHNAISELPGCRRAPIPDLQPIGIHRTKMRRRYADSNRSYQRGHRSRLIQQPACLIATMEWFARDCCRPTPLRGQLVEKKDAMQQGRRNQPFAGE
jgi:hypothetical protein